MNLPICPSTLIPEEYNKLLSIYQTQAGMGELPGQAGYEAALSTRTARGTVLLLSMLIALWQQ